MFLRRVALPALFGFFVGCGDDGGGSTTPPDLSVESDGPHVVGLARVEVTDPARGRTLPVQLWYPAAPGSTAADVPIETLEDDPNRTTYAGLLASADPACPTRTLRAAQGATPDPGAFPLVVVSHCHECTRWSTATVSARLASHGFVVLAMDHVGNTLWDGRAGTGLPLDASTLAIRTGDVDVVLDQLLAGAGPPFSAELRAAIDPSRIGMMGHSFGAVTTGKVAQEDPRIRAALALAAPMENPLLPGVDVAAIAVPVGFLLAQEDNSITELGNGFIRSNFAEATAGAWKAEVADAGHWSVSDLVGVTPGFAPGCGDGTRQTDGAPFTYLPAATGRAITAAYTTAFFRAHLEEDAGARAYLATPRPAGTVTVELK